MTVSCDILVIVVVTLGIFEFKLPIAVKLPVVVRLPIVEGHLIRSVC
jgi:hypothetical protein